MLRIMSRLCRDQAKFQDLKVLEGKLQVQNNKLLLSQTFHSCQDKPTRYIVCHNLKPYFTSYAEGDCIRGDLILYRVYVSSKSWYARNYS
jgi:hypothetical protein